METVNSLGQGQVYETNVFCLPTEIHVNICLINLYNAIYGTFEGLYLNNVFMDNIFYQEAHDCDSLVVKTHACCMHWRSRVQSADGEPTIFHRPSSAKFQLDVIRMRL